MSEKPKRPWFRFQLLTLVLLALAAGGMMWANTGERVYKEYQTVLQSSNPQTRLW
jgi:hypothetical protein